MAKLYKQYIFIIMLVILFSFDVKSKDYKFYYMSVGNEHYASFNEQPGIGLSARVVSEYFEQFGAIEGVTLRSKSGQYLSKKMIIDNINQLTLKMNDDGRENVFIFYYAGHCLGESLTGQQWLIPGNTKIDVNELLNSEVDTDTFDEAFLSPIELHGAMQNSLAGQSLLIMDCCYGAGDQAYKNVATYLTKSLGPRQARFLKDFRAVNLSDDAWTTSLFATSPGKSTYSVKAPDFMANRIVYPIGPLARRISLTLNPLKSDRGVMSYLEFIEAMKDSDLDEVTQPAISFNRDIYNDGKLLSYSRPFNSVSLKQLYSGSAHLKELKLVKATSKKVVVVSEAEEGSLIDISSNMGDWVGGGKNTSVSTADYEIFVAQDLDRLVIYAEGPLRNNYWNFEILLPKEHSLGNVSEDIEDPDKFYWMGHNEIEITASGRGCSERSGKRNVKLYKRNEQGSVTRLKIDFTHFCDGNTSGLKGHMDLKLKPLFSYL